jgi:SPP1 family predicted phage head-tail adaptor
MRGTGNDLRAGDLRQRISIEKDATAKTTSGGTRPWTTVVTVAASIAAKIEEYAAGRETFGPQPWTVALTGYRVWIRYRTDVAEQMRVKFGTRYLAIRQVPTIDRSQEFIGLVCEEVKANG